MQADEGLQAYAPRLLLEHLALDPHRHVRPVDGTVVFVDVSGFTRLSERLARKGREGAEQLAGAIGESFTTLLAFAYAEGGSLLKFGGDALLLLFVEEGHAVRACRAAHRMRQALRTAGRIGFPGAQVTLRMSAAVHTASFDVFLAGTASRELLITGPAASHVVALEHAARAGEILISTATAAEVPAAVVGRPAGDGRLLRSSPGRVTGWIEPAAPSLDRSILAGCFSSELREHILGGRVVPEHRVVAIGFVRFGGVDALIREHGAAAVAVDLDELVDDVHNAAERHQVCVLGSDIDRDGGKLILAAGAPRATGDDAERMMLALGQVFAKRDRRVSLRSGVTYGPVFAGDIGPPHRRTYTVMGDVVNLAARLMAAAPDGEIYVTPAVLDGSATRFSVARLAPLRVKGKARPVEALSVGRALGRRGREADLADRRWPLLGRDAELRLLDDLLAAVLEGHGRLLELVGEPGIGKTRLLDELRARVADVRALQVTCEPYASAMPYGAWRRLLRQVLRVQADLGDDKVLARLETFVAAAEPMLASWLPLLAIPLGLTVPPSPEVRELDDVNRRAKLAEVVVAFLAAGLTTPTLIEIEDAQHMDAASRELLDAVLRSAGPRPWLFAVTRREVDSSFPPVRSVTSTRLELGPLGGDAIRTLARAATERVRMAPSAVELAAERSGGNPQLLRDLLRTVAAGGDGELPASVEAAATARIDRLAPADRDLVRRAAVLGRSFDPRLLPVVSETTEARREAQTWTRLRRYFEPDGDWHMRFRRQVVWEAAYAGLPFGTRRRLHTAVGRTLERRAGAGGAERATLLALHFSRAGDDARTWRYARVAGDSALERLAPGEAADAYRRALDAARRLDVTRAELSATWEALGDALTHRGELDAAHGAFREARRLVADDRVAQGRLLLRHAELAVEAGRVRPGVRWAARGLRAVQGVDDPRAAAEEARLLAMLATIRQREGRADAAIALCRRAMAAAEATGEERALAHACHVLDWALVESGRSRPEGHAARALEIYRRLGDVGREAAVLNNLGGFAYREGRWKDAVSLYLRGAEASARSGSAANAAFGDCNVGELLSDQGHWDEGEGLLVRARQVWRGSGYDWGVAYASAVLGRLAARTGRHGQATARLLDARARFVALGVQPDVRFVDALLAEAEAFAGDAAAALGRTDALLAVPEMGLLASLLRRVRGFAHALRGDRHAARAELAASLAAARARDDPFETLLTLDALEAVGPRRAQRAAEAAEFARRLDVVRIARPALGDLAPTVPGSAGASHRVTRRARATTARS